MRFSLVFFLSIALFSNAYAVTSINLTLPDNNTVTNNVSLSFHFAHIGTGSANCALLIGGAFAGKTEAFSGYPSVINSSPSEGNHTWSVECTDKNTLESGKFIVFVDRTPPLAPVTASPERAYLNDKISITCPGTIVVYRPDGTQSGDSSLVFSDTKANGTYTVKCTAKDWAGNKMDNRTAFEIVPDKSLLYRNPNETEIWQSVATGAVMESVIQNTKIDVRKVILEFNGSAESVKLGVEKLAEGYSKSPEESVYSFHRIETNYPGKILKATIEFEVDNLWLEDHSISLPLFQRLNNQTWEKITVSLMQKYPKKTRFFAVANGLSIFAITSQSPLSTSTTIAAAQTDQTATTILKYCGNGQCEGDEANDANYCPADCSVAQEKKRDIIVYVVIGLIVLGSVLFFFMR